MIKFTKFFGITFLFLITITVGTMYLSVITEEGLIKPTALFFYTIVLIGYGLTLIYIWGREKNIELEQARIELEMAKREAENHKKELEQLKREFEEFKKRIAKETE